MTKDDRETTLDAKLAALKAASPDRDLRSLEPDVWSRVDDARAHRPADGLSGAIAIPRQARGAVFGFALAIGFAVGILGAGQSAVVDDFSVFSADAPFAPSTLLG